MRAAHRRAARSAGALLVPLSHLWLLIATVPEQVYTLGYYVVIAGLLAVGLRDRVAARRSRMSSAERGVARDGVVTGAPTG